MKKFMKKNGDFNLQEKKAHPIFADVTETQTPFCRMNDTRRLLQKSFSIIHRQHKLYLLIKTDLNYGIY